MGFYGNITNTSRTQFQFDKTYPSRFKMTELCPKDGVYIGRYVLVDYDADPNNVIKDGYRKGRMADFKDGSFLYQSPDLNENFKITYFEDEYWDYDWSTTDVINGVLEGTIVRVLETVDQYKEYNEYDQGVGTPEVYAGNYSFYECIGYTTGERQQLNPETGQLETTTVRIAQFKKANAFTDNYSRNYNEDKNAYGKEIGRGWDSTVWQKVYENGEEKYVMIAELNSVVPTFDIQADAPSMSPLTPHFDEGSTNVYYKLHWQPQWGLRTRAANGELKTLQIDKNGVKIKTKDPIYTSTSVDLKKQAETYPSDVNTYWEKYEYDTEEGNQVKYQYNILDQQWEKNIDLENKEKYEIPAAIFFNKDGFSDENIYHTETTRQEEVKNEEWDGTTDFISIKPTGWSGHQYSAHDGFKELKAAPDTQELMVMLPSVGNTISEVWDLIYGGLNTNSNISATGKRNKVIEWENPIKQLHRKGLRLIEEQYTPISLEQILISGWKANTYYILNEDQVYELISEEQPPEGVEEFYVRSGGYTYNKNQIATLAGCMNSVYDLMGMIIVDKKETDIPENAIVEGESSDYIYYYPFDGTYRVKDFTYTYDNLDEKDYYNYYKIIYNEEDAPQNELYLVEDFETFKNNFLSYMYYVKNGNNYIPVSEGSSFSSDESYYVRKLNVNKNELFKPITLGTFKKGYFQTSDGSYIWKDGGTPDNNVTYYDINAEKIIGDSSIWPRSFEHVYKKNKYFYKTFDEQSNKNVYKLMQTNICERSKKPFSEIPHDGNTENNHPYLTHIANTTRYDYDKMNKPTDPDQALTWKGPYRSEGYWSEKDDLWLENEYVYPTYFFTQGTYYQVHNGDGTGDVNVNGISYVEIIETPQDGYAYILDRPRANTNIEDETPVYGNPIGYYKVKLIDYDKLDEKTKSHLYYGEEEDYEEEVEKVNEDGQPILDDSGNPVKEIVKKTRFVKWTPVTKKDIDDFYKYIGRRRGGIDSEEVDNLRPKKTIYYIEPGEEIDYFYEPNRYYYLGTDEKSYIKDKNPKFTENTEYFDSANFTIHKSDDDYEKKENGELILDGNNKPISKCAIVPQGDTGHYYLPNKYYFYNESSGKYELDESHTARENVTYYERNDIYVSNDNSNIFSKGSSWNLNALIIPNTVTLGKRIEKAYMKELKGFGRDYNTINGLIVQLNKLISADNYDTRDRSTLQGAINYLNDMINNFDSLTPGDIPIIDDYGRLHGGKVLGDDWTNIDINRNVEEPTLTITHTYNPVEKSDTTSDVNTASTTAKKNKLTWDTYTFDEMGHQVGKAVHTVTLPYGFKTIKATNTEDNAVNEPDITIKDAGQIADNTQDTLTFSASNRWIKFDNNTEDTVKVGHLLSPFIDETVPNHLYGLTQDEDHTKSTNELGDLDKDNTFEVPCFQFDEAGHILEARTHTVTLPEVFNKFKVSAESEVVTDMAYTAGTVTADNMNDTVTLTPGNRWIHMAVSGTSGSGTKDTDTIKIAHEVSDFKYGEANKEYGLLANETIGDTNNEFEIPAFEFDEAGHIRGARVQILTLPFGFTKFTKATHTTTTNVDKTSGGSSVIIEPDTMTDTLTIKNGNNWICIDGNTSNDSFTFSHYVKEFTESEASTDLNENGKFTVQELGWDRAGHLISSNKRTYTLPYNFKTIEVTGTSSAVSDSTSGTDGTIVADTQVDTLKLLPGNKWIQLVGNAEDDSVTFKHYVNKFTQTTDTTDNNVLSDNTISTQELTWDEAGHLTGSIKKTYTLPYNFKTFTVSNSGKDSTSSTDFANGSLIAENQIEEMTLDAGNRWITLTADNDNKKVAVFHAVAGTASISKGDTEPQTPKFGDTFKVLSAGIDQTGHVSSLEEHTVQIPKPSLSNDIEGNAASVLTKLSLEDTTGAFSTEHKNVGELLITGYKVASTLSTIAVTDSINTAFGKIQKAFNVLNSDSETDGSIAKAIKELELDIRDGSTTSFDTFGKIQSWISDGKDGEKSLVSRVQNNEDILTLLNNTDSTYGSINYRINQAKLELRDNCSDSFDTFAKIEAWTNDGSETPIVERVQILESKSLPSYNELENDEIYVIKMVENQPTWINLASWTGGKY